MGNDRTLPDSELDIMLVVWSSVQPISPPEILDQLERPLTASALHSYLKRLEEKGFLSCAKQGKRNLYTALVSRSEYQRSAGNAMLKKLYKGSLAHFAAALYDGEQIDQHELHELQKLLEQLGKGETS